ncbi:unnamed protein product [Acanthosepion pharaonis]|uniref:Uncharacterized protein n=1 Tax=Acanthosepion pharaonis TaxID=158019 RepID=A0A812BJD7_ACAPH|nr:unnamed protein product [Sepia pharaonis]
MWERFGRRMSRFDPAVNISLAADIIRDDAAKVGKFFDDLYLLLDVDAEIRHQFCLSDILVSLTRQPSIWLGRHPRLSHPSAINLAWPISSSLSTVSHQFGLSDILVSLNRQPSIWLVRHPRLSQPSAINLACPTSSSLSTVSHQFGLSDILVSLNRQPSILVVQPPRLSHSSVINSTHFSFSFPASLLISLFLYIST